jgi:hypothetical protein
MVPEEEIVWLIVSKPSVEIDSNITMATIAKKTWVDSHFKKPNFMKNAPN